MSESIDDIVRVISKLESVGMTYVAPDGSVYFSLARFEAAGFKYHKLRPPCAPHHPLAGGDPHGMKRDPRDFVLWKRCDDPLQRGSSWDSPWGVGRPGWHIECTAMGIFSRHHPWGIEVIGS